MSTKRQPSKQRRQTQNRQQRAALQARRAAAAAGPVPVAKVGSGTSSPTTGAKSGSVLARLTGTSGTSRASRPSGASRRQAMADRLPTGHRAALTAVMLSAATLIFVLAAFRVPVSDSGDIIATRPERVAEWSLAVVRTVASEGPEATADEVRAAVDDWSPGGKQPYITAFWPQSLFVFLPLIGAALGFRAVSKRASAKVVNRAMYATLFGALLTMQLLTFFLPGVVAMAVASFQVRKAELAAQAEPDDDEPDDDEPDDEDELVDELEEDDVDETDELGDEDETDELDDEDASAP